MDSKNQLLSMNVEDFLEFLENSFRTDKIDITQYEEIRSNYFNLNKIEDNTVDFKPLNKEFYTNRFVKIEEYNSFKEITKHFPALKDVNKENNLFDENEHENMKVLICRSKNYDDLHKAIKYGVWTSGRTTNNFIKKHFHTHDIYIIYTVLKTEYFYGVAKVTSKTNENIFYNYWTEPAKWKGLTQLKWVYLSLIDFGSINIKLDGELVSNLKDGKVLQPEQYMELFEHFENCIETDEDNLDDTILYKKLLTKFNGFDNKEKLLRENRDLMVKTGMINVVFGDNTDYNQKNRKFKPDEDKIDLIPIVKKKNKKRKK